MSQGSLINALTIDFEDWYQGLDIPSVRWSEYEDRIVPVTHRLLALFADAGVRATFFVLGHLAEQHPALIREIAAAGHEIGTHGYSHTPVYRQTPDVFREELQRSVKALSDITGKPVHGHRAAFFSITRDSLWALDIVAELGLRYDSSIHPVRNFRYGIHDAPRWLHEIQAGDRRLLEFPISTLRILGQNLPMAGGAYFRIYPYFLTRTAFRALNRQGKTGVFYLHPWELDPEQPRVALPWRVRTTHYMNLHRTEGRLRRLLADFRFAPLGEVLNVC
jgi:polysaccharide deacetylase family protein (PEP-CTERM system associated)